MTPMLPAPPAVEPPAITSTDGLAPRFRAGIFDLLADLVEREWQPMLRETLRTTERAAYLFGFGREYDDPDPRGIVTNAPTAAKTWHHYGLAVDIIDRRYGDDAPIAFWRDLEQCAVARGLTSGSDWKRPDDPHVQWQCPGMLVTPSDHAATLLASDGVEAVWRELHAIEEDS